VSYAATGTQDHGASKAVGSATKEQGEISPKNPTAKRKKAEIYSRESIQEANTTGARIS
jgi:hypothetical protein